MENFNNTLPNDLRSVNHGRILEVYGFSSGAKSRPWSPVCSSDYASALRTHFSRTFILILSLEARPSSRNLAFRTEINCSHSPFHGLVDPICHVFEIVLVNEVRGGHSL
jgi:hypothetical protein